MRAVAPPIEDLRTALLEAVVQTVETLRRSGFRSLRPWPDFEGHDAHAKVVELLEWATHPDAGSPRGPKVTAAVQQLELVADTLALLTQATSIDERVRLARTSLAGMALGLALGNGPWNQARGRPRGSGYSDSDAAFVEEMRQRLVGGEKASAVARELAPRMPGGGTVESKANRLLRRARQEK